MAETLPKAAQPATAITIKLSVIGCLKEERVYERVGKREALLDLVELGAIIHLLTTQNYEDEMITFINASEFNIHASKETSWTLDGEYQEGMEEIKVVNMHHAIDLIMNGKFNGRK